MKKKPSDKYENKRKALVNQLVDYNYIKDKKIEKAMLAVKRDDFVLPEHKDRAYEDSPLPIPDESTISAPHMHAIYLSSAELKTGDDVLEIGAGSGILLAYVKEIVGKKGNVVGVEISPDVYRFAKNNLEKAGYSDKVKLVLSDGIKNVKKRFNKIFLSATTPDIPKEFVDMLKSGGVLIAPVGNPYGNQELLLVKKNSQGKAVMKSLGPVAFVPMRGEIGFN